MPESSRAEQRAGAPRTDTVRGRRPADPIGRTPDAGWGEDLRVRRGPGSSGKRESA